MSSDGDLAVHRRVLSDVLSPFTSIIHLRVIYNSAVSNGCHLDPSDVADRPRVYISGGPPRFLYTLVMIDPDAPSLSNPTHWEYLHWLVTDIPANSDASCGNDVVAYEAPRPTESDHRFVFVLFRQTRMQNVFLPRLRRDFNTRSFASVFQLGPPVSALYFYCHRVRFV